MFNFETLTAELIKYRICDGDFPGDWWGDAIAILEDNRISIRIEFSWFNANGPGSKRANVSLDEKKTILAFNADSDVPISLSKNEYNVLRDIILNELSWAEEIEDDLNNP